MKAILIEDEHSTAQNLEHLLNALKLDIEIIEIIETVADAIAFFKQEKAFDLVFMDIHLADGNSFEIVKEVELSAPIIFTTAYDQYAIKAFKLNSIDYLLKPIQEEELKNAILKFKARHVNATISSSQLDALLSLIPPQKAFRNSFLVQKKDTLIPLSSSDFAFFNIQDGVVRGTTNENVTYHVNERLEDLENDLNPEEFFRVNRQYLVQRAAIKNLQEYFNGRLVVNLQPEAKEPVIVSRANASRVKTWLQGASS